jgi:hypothetical protein
MQKWRIIPFIEGELIALRFYGGSMSYHIFGRIKNQVIIFVGCSRTAAPADSIVLQTVEDHPDVHWVKWCVRFRRTLTDQKALTHPYASYFKNSARTIRLFGDKNFADFAAKQSADFLEFHRNNPDLMAELIQAALAKKAEGQAAYSLDQLLGDIRWSNGERDRGAGRFKVDGRWSGWYSRSLQMIEPRLIGFFAVRSSAADALEWDGRSWGQFAAEHDDKIQWSDPFDNLPDSDWEYTE